MKFAVIIILSKILELKEIKALIIRPGRERPFKVFCFYFLGGCSCMPLDL